MTFTLKLSPEIEAGLLARAQASGMDLERYLESLVEEVASSARQNSAKSEQQARSEAVRRMIEFSEKYHLSLGEPITRKLLHESHRY